MKNAFRASLLSVVILIAGLAGCAGSGQKTGTYVDDSWITTKVKSDMIADHDVKAHNITVKTTKGVVTLTGTAETWQESDKATQIARNVKGVTSVENDLRIQ